MHLSRTARISIMTAYWSAVTAGSLALLFSMVTTLWGPRTPGAQASVADRRTWCIGQLALLHAELEQETKGALGPFIKAGDASLSRRQRWQRKWTQHLDTVQSQCTQPPAVQQALQQLNTLAQRYDGVVVAWQSAQTQLSAPIEAALIELVEP